MFDNLPLFTQALGLQEPWKVDEIVFDKDKGRLDIYILRNRGSKHPCPECGEECHIHDTKNRAWRHLNFFQYQAYIHCNMPRTKCTTHGIKQVDAPWARAGSGFTMLLEAFIMELARVMPVNSLANLIGEYDTKIWRVINHYIDKAREQEDYSNVVNIGIDETSSKRGHNYVSVFVDLDKPKVIYARPFFFGAGTPGKMLPREHLLKQILKNITVTRKT